MIDWKDGEFVNERGDILTFKKAIGLINNTISVLDEESYRDWLRRDITEIAQCMARLLE